MNRLAQCVWLLLMVTGQLAFAQNEIRWAPDLASAQRAANQYEVPLLLHFYSDNCLPCRILDDRVYSQPTVSTTLNKYFICVRINGGQDPKTCTQYNVHSFPTDVYLSGDGTLIYQEVCKQDVNSYMEVLQRVAVMNRDRNTLLAANTAKQNNHAGYANGDSVSLPAATTAAAETAGPNRFAGLLDGRSNGTITANNRAPAIPTTSGPLSASNQASSITGPSSPDSMRVAAANGNGLKDSQAGLPPLPASLNRAPLGNNAIANNNPNALAGQNGLPTNGQNSAHPASKDHASEQLATSKSTQLPGILVSNPYYQNEEPMVCTPDGRCGPASQMLGQSPIESTIAKLTTPQTYSTTASALAAGANSSTSPAATTPAGTATAAAQLISSPKHVATLAVANEPPALNGCCPVMFVTNRQYVPGSATFVIRHRGRNYWLQNAQNAQQFLQKPDLYSPKLSGYDPMVLLNEGKLVDGSTQFAMQDPSTGAVFLFSNANSRDQFAANQEKALAALETLLRSATVN